MSAREQIRSWIRSWYRVQILDLARDAGLAGITCDETERLILAHKNHSVSPRFAELVKCGSLVRVRLGYSKKGRRIFLRRYDSKTQQNVIVYWTPEFVPEAVECPPTLPETTERA